MITARVALFEALKDLLQAWELELANHPEGSRHAAMLRQHIDDTLKLIEEIKP